ncbi:MAG: site-specific integrase [Rhizomicrobium sp.]
MTGGRKIAYRTVRGTKKQAEAELSKAVAEMHAGGFIDGTNMTVKEYLGRWLKDHAAVTVSAKTLERYTELADRHLSPRLGAHALQKLTPMHIQNAYSDMLESGRIKGGGGLSARTVHHVHRLLFQALRQAVRWQLLSRNPAEAVTPPKPPPTEIAILDEDQVGVLLKAARSTRMYTPILLAITTGLRRGEVFGLRWTDIDLENGRLSVAQALEQTKAGIAFKAPKTKRSRRTVTLPSVTIEALRAHRAKQAAERLALGLGKDDLGLVFTSPLGAPVSVRAVSKEFARIVKRAKLPPLTFHGLRHSHLTALLKAGVHPKIASERAGHASVAITMDVYSHVLPSMQDGLTGGVDAAIRKALAEQT